MASPDSKAKKSSGPDTSEYTTQDLVLSGIKGLTSIVFVLTTTYLAYHDRLSVLQPRDRIAAIKSVSTFAGKIEFTSKYWILPAMWIFFNLHIVMNGRRSSGAINPLSGNDHKVQAQKNILANSIEQVILTILLQVSALHYLTPIQVVNLAPLVNLLFLIGRIIFWLGYPKQRTLGFAINISSCLTMLTFAVTHFVRQAVDLNPESLFKLKL